MKVHVNDPQETTAYSTTTALLLQFIESQLDHTYYNLWAKQRWLCLANVQATALLPDFIFWFFAFCMWISLTQITAMYPKNERIILKTNLTSCTALKKV